MLEYDFDLEVVINSGDDGPGISKLKGYNTIIWMTGNATTNTLTAADEQAITAYLEGNYWETKYLENFVPNIWIIGQDILEDITGGDTMPDMSSFAFRYLKVEEYLPDYGLPANLEGVYHDEIAHGVDYPISPQFADNADAIRPTLDADGIIYAFEPDDIYFGLRYSGRDFNLLLFTFEFAFIEDYFSFVNVAGGGSGEVLGPPTTLFEDGFETAPGQAPPPGWAEWTDGGGGPYWITDNINVKTGGGSAYCPGDIGGFQMRMFPDQFFDLTGYSNIYLSFDWYIAGSVGTDQGLFLDISYGGTWYLGVAWYTGTSNSRADSTRAGTWIHQDIFLDPLITKTGDFQFGFRWSYPGFGAWVDNVYLNASLILSAGGSGTGNVTVTDDMKVYYKPELVFLSMSWFGYEDNRVELKTSTVDIALSNEHPMVGNSYVIKSEVYNYGGNATSAIVRFLDGNTIIDTKSLHVAAGGRTSIEVIWTPLYVGNRELIVDVDPDLDLKDNSGSWLEIFRFNNKAELPRYVYFFFDDMENGSDKWEHDSTIVNINGESKLDYTDGLDVDIISDFDWNETSSKWIHDYTSSHTINSAFSIMEPEVKGKIRQPIDAVIQVDSSRHMAGSKWTNLKLAIHAFLDVLESIDRVAINTYETGTSVDLDWIKMGDTNIDMSAEPGWGGSPVFATGRDVAEYYVDDLNLGYAKYPTGGSPLWREIGESIHQANLTHRAEAMPFVLALADAENTAKGGYDPDINYTGDKTGLLEAPFTVYTILLGEPGNKNHDPNYDNNDQETPPRDEDGWKQGNVRYNSKDHYDMWNIARSSNPSGKHYYIDDSSSLVNLFG
ncbi:MAG: hypothetical protein ACYS21_12565, partial [Planctomycetota bacterium]